MGRMEAHYAVLSGGKGNTGTRTDVHQYSAGRMLEAGHDAADDSGGNLRPARGIQRGSAERRSGADDGRRHAGQPTGI